MFSLTYAKGSAVSNLFENCEEVSWSSRRGQLSQVLTGVFRDAPSLKEGGYIIANENKTPLFYGPIVTPEYDEFTRVSNIQAYEVTWYFAKNKAIRPLLKGEAGEALQLFVRSFGVDFTCPPLGFKINERYGNSYISDIIQDVLDRAQQHTGYYYHLISNKNKISVAREGTNKSVPVLIREHLESSTISSSIEETFTAVMVQRMDGDKVLETVTKESASAIKEFGRMLEIIEIQKEENANTIADTQLSLLSKPKTKRTIRIRQYLDWLAPIRAGWLILIKEYNIDKKYIVTSANANYKNGVFTLNLELERRF
jgi:hypothetical protein